MDSQDRDESKIRRRDEMLARRVGEALDQMKPGSPGECPDAATIAAYSEQALEPAELAQWESHFAECARCRQIVRVLSASVDTPLAEKEVAHLGKLVSTARAPIEIKRNAGERARPRMAEWRTRWLAPALGVAAVLCVWLVMRPPWRATDRGTSSTLVAQAPKDEAPPTSNPQEADRLSRVAPQQDQKTAAAPERFSANARSFNAPVEAPSKRREEASNEIGGISPGASNKADSLQEKKESTSLADGREVQPQTVPAAPPALPKAQAGMEVPAARQSEAKEELDRAAKQTSTDKTKTGAMSNASPGDKEAATLQGETREATGRAVRPQTPPESQSSIRSDQTFALSRPIQNYSSLLKAPSGSILWRAGKGGVIERSTDAGKTWASQASPSQQDWLAGAAVSDTTGWVAGRRGAIARTIDGEHWESISPPAQAAEKDAQLPDWTGITARDAQSATITANDGRKFATADGGMTWQAQ